ncbi:DUF3955 domain-containing protein [Veillonella agrestimuris]|uniref:DUF3955 domain-containing protein n=1 Tax=Veillonella agrestimuris TaxID=2941340 RepID=UPI00203A8AF6|nr:DUF3955 domain-containing protein [Veillonella agrestimuris]
MSKPPLILTIFLSVALTIVNYFYISSEVYLDSNGILVEPFYLVVLTSFLLIALGITIIWLLLSLAISAWRHYKG